MRREAFTGLLLAWALSGCASRPAPGAPVPESPFELRVVPAIAFAGGMVRLTCYIPESLGRGTFRLALEGARATGPAVIERNQNVLEIPRTECGSWKATCRVVAENGSRFAERDVEVRGGMCEGGQVAVPAR